MLTQSRSEPQADVLVIDERDIRRNGPGNILTVCWRQWHAERELARRGVSFRTTDPAAADTAYSAMTEEEFEAVNGRQDWANWRTIARSMSGLVPNRPLRIIDLGCGSGGSTRVLAFYAPPGSRVIGYELARPLVNIAQRRRYLHKSGTPVEVEFCCQPANEMLRAPDGRPVPERTIDLANASGVVGHHFTPEMARDLGTELQRVLRPGGLAMLDAGAKLPADRLTAIMTSLGFTKLRRRRSSPLDPTGQVVFRAP